MRVSGSLGYGLLTHGKTCRMPKWASYRRFYLLLLVWLGRKFHAISAPLWLQVVTVLVCLGLGVTYKVWVATSRGRTVAFISLCVLCITAFAVVRPAAKPESTAPYPEVSVTANKVTRDGTNLRVLIVLSSANATAEVDLSGAVILDSPLKNIHVEGKDYDHYEKRARCSQTCRNYDSESV